MENGGLQRRSRRKKTDNKPCSACRILRRKCSLNCSFAKYFPSDDPYKFAVVHRVFGASNLIRLIQDVEEEKREDTVRSMVYEAEARRRDPVYGCVASISSLQERLLILETKLALLISENFRLKSLLSEYSSSSSYSPNLTHQYEEPPTHVQSLDDCYYDGSSFMQPYYP